MPLALEPNETYEVTLESDAAKPEKERAKFRFRYLTLREFRNTAWLADDKKRIEELSADRLISALLEAIAVNLVGWSNIPIPFVAESLPDVVTASEAWELFYQARRQSRLSVTEKNSSDSPSAGNSAASAGDADPETAKTQ